MCSDFCQSLGQRFAEF
jgi:hypothetical protein